MRGYPRNQGHSTLRYQQEQFDIQKHQRAAYEQVGIAATSSRTAAQKTSRFREIEIHVGAFNSEDYCPFRVSPGTRSSATLSISRSYGRDDSERHSQSRGSLPVKKCTSTLSSQAELKENMERSNTEGAQLRNLYEKTRNANANIAADVVRLQPRGVPRRCEVKRRSYKHICCLSIRRAPCSFQSN